MAGLVPSNREGLRIYPPVWETGPPCRSFQPYVIGVSQKLSNASTNIFIFIPCFWHAGIKTQHLIPAVFSQLTMSNQTLAPETATVLYLQPLQTRDQMWQRRGPPTHISVLTRTM